MLSKCFVNLDTMSPFHKKKAAKSFPVKVITFDSELEFYLEDRATGQDLFDLVCRTIGLRETWYFGLQYENKRGEASWLKTTKKVKDQKINWKAGNCIFNFYAKFFPENVSEELVQEITQHLFFLQVKQSILCMDIYCPPEASVLLASYAVHVQFGPYDYENYVKGMLAQVAGSLLPQRVIDQYQMTPQMWEDRIKTWYEDHEPMTRDEVEMEYLKIAQDLDMYGVNYFPITNKKHSELWLGVTAMGLNIYEKTNKLTPKTTFQWSEIRDVSFDDKKFTIRPVESKSPNFVFYSQNLRINKLILDLCIGNHDLYMKRRKQDTMEIQQMKTQAKEEKQRRQIERGKFLREKKLRESAEREKNELEKHLRQLQEEMRIANEALRRSEETKELYFEKNRVNEEQVHLTECKANKFKQEMDRLRENHIKTEKEKLELEKKVREADVFVHQLTEEKENMKKELQRAKVAEREAAIKLLKFQSENAQNSLESILEPPSTTTSLRTETTFALEDTSDHDVPTELYLTEDDVEQITNEIELSRLEYIEKTKQVQSQLRTLRSEIELLKIEENQCPLDIISAEQLMSGETKYSTLKKLKSGSTKARVAFYEEL